MEKIPAVDDNKELSEVFRKAAEDFFLKGKKDELYRQIMRIVEKPLIELTLRQTKGNKIKAAKMLGINRNTLHAKIKKLSIDAKGFKTLC